MYFKKLIHEGNWFIGVDGVLITLIVLLVLTSFYIYAKNNGLLFKSSNIQKSVPTKIISPTLTSSPTPNIIEELEAAINTANNPNLVVIVDRIIGDYARGQIGSSNGAGSGWYAVRINGKWKKIAQGQNMGHDECSSLVQQYNIPKEIIECKVVTPTPEYVIMTLDRCVFFFPDQKGIKKSCLSKKRDEINDAGYQCVKLYLSYKECSDEYLKNNCNEDCDALPANTTQEKINILECKVKKAGGCGINSVCSRPNADKENEAYLDLISKYCKDI